MRHARRQIAPPLTPPPGFSVAEWEAALATGRAIEVDAEGASHARRATPVAVSLWFGRLAARSVADRLSARFTASRPAHSGEVTPAVAADRGATDRAIRDRPVEVARTAR